MTAIGTTFALRDTPTVAQWNAWGKALAALGLTDDNGGYPAFAKGNPIAPGLPLALGGSETSKSVYATTYTVPGGKWYTVRYIYCNGGAIVITPFGGAGFNFTSAGGGYSADVYLILGPGDAITTPATSVCTGPLIPAPAGLTRILQTVSSTVPYPVPALRRFIMTSASAVGGTTVNTVLLAIDGTNAMMANAFDIVAAGSANTMPPQLLAATQSVASSSAVLILISGWTETTAT
jgi:hypothetical protein